MDPDLLNSDPDPDPAFQVSQDPIWVQDFDDEKPGVYILENTPPPPPGGGE